MILLITLWDKSASWDNADLEWVSRDSATQKLLNDTVPDSINDYSVPFQKGGAMGMALEAAQAVFGDRIVVLKRKDPPVPDAPEKGEIQ